MAVELMESDQRLAIERLEKEIHDALLMSEDDIAASLFRTYQEQLNAIIKDLLWLNSSFLEGPDKTLTQWRALQLDTQSLNLIAARMTGLNQMIAQQIISDLVDFGQESYNMTTWALDQTTPPSVEPEYNLPTDDVIKSFIGAPWEGQMFSDRMGHKTDKMARALQGTLIDGIMAGDSVQDIARDMRVNTGIPPEEKLLTRPRASKMVYDALMIARTEAMRLNSAMRNRIFDDNEDLLDDPVWSAAPGFIRVCERCQERDGMTRSEIGENFEDDDDPPLHPQCRCIYRMVPKPFQELVPAELRDAAKGVFGESISDYEMKTYNPESQSVTNVKIQPFSEWMDERRAA